MKRLILLFALALPAFSAARVGTLDFASDFQTLPVVANVTGVGNARFISYVALLNPTATAFPVDVTLYEPSGNTRSATITLAAGEQKAYVNFLETVFGYSGGGAATFRSANPARRFILTSEVRTGANGAYTTPVAPLEFPGTNSRSYATGISVDATWRTNIGCFNQTNAANAIKATLYDTTGTLVLGTVNFTLPANGWGQTSVPTVVSDGFIQFDPSEIAVCYASVVNNATNDARFVSASEFEP